MVHKTPIHSEIPPTLREAVLLLAKLGGFLGRKGDDEPGVTIIYRGAAHLNDIAQMWAILHCQQFANEMGMRSPQRREQVHIRFICEHN